jgi:hypothetical protein
LEFVAFLPYWVAAKAAGYGVKEFGLSIVTCLSQKSFVQLVTVTQGLWLSNLSTFPNAIQEPRFTGLRQSSFGTIRLGLDCWVARKKAPPKLLVHIEPQKMVSTG